MGFIYRYELENKSNRETIDLTKHENNIVNALEDTFKSKLIYSKVFSDYFEFTLDQYIASNFELQSMGRNIVKKDIILGQNKKNSAKNSRLFRRKNNYYFGFIEEIEFVNGMYSLKLDLVDKGDCEKIKNNDNSSQLSKVDILKNLSAFSMIIEIKEKDKELLNQTLLNRVIKNSNEAEEYVYKWCLIKGKHVNKGNSLMFLDYTKRQDIESNFKIQSIKLLDKEESTWFEQFFSLKEIQYSDVIELNESKTEETDLFIAVYNVGQGLCSAICNNKSQPIVYFDFGGGERQDAVTYPNDIKFCFKLSPKIILSHWHRDHWIGAHHCKEALKMEWIIPDQKIGAQATKLCGEISKVGKLTVLNASKGIVKTPLGSLTINNGKSKHYHDNGIAFLVELNKHERYLMPGDNRYQYLPPKFLKDLNGIVASHHGGSYFKDKIGRNCIPFNNKNGDIVYSYGKHGKFHPKNNSHGHPSFINEYAAKNWVKDFELHTPEGHCVLGLKKAMKKCSCGCNLEIK